MTPLGRVIGRLMSFRQNSKQASRSCSTERQRVGAAGRKALTGDVSSKRTRRRLTLERILPIVAVSAIEKNATIHHRRQRPWVRRAKSQPTPNPDFREKTQVPRGRKLSGALARMPSRLVAHRSRMRACHELRA